MVPRRVIVEPCHQLAASPLDLGKLGAEVADALGGGSLSKPFAQPDDVADGLL